VNSGARGRWFVTPHAVWRYIERIRPGIDYEMARDELIEESLHAHFVRRQGNGDLWRGRRPLRLRFIVGWTDEAVGGLPPLLTVVVPHDRWRGP